MESIVTKLWGLEKQIRARAWRRGAEVLVGALFFRHELDRRAKVLLTATVVVGSSGGFHVQSRRHR